MAMFEYHVVPAPRRGVKARGARTTEEQFAQALSQAMNAAAADGWEYLRTDTLPCEERQGLTGRTTVYQNMLVFRRSSAESARDALRAEVERADAARAVQHAGRPATPLLEPPSAPDISLAKEPAAPRLLTNPVVRPLGPATLRPDPSIAASLGPATLPAARRKTDLAAE